MQTGIAVTAPLEGLVSELDEREAAHFGNYTWVQWRRLPREERIRGIAHHRMHGLIEAHTNDAVNRAATMRARVRGQH